MEYRTLGTVATYINGRAFKPSEWEQNGLPIIRIQNLNDEDASYNYCSQSLDEKFKVKKGDLLFAWSASLGAHIWNKDNAWLNQHIFKVIPDKDVNKMFLYYYLCKVTMELYSKAHGTGMVHITKKPFMNTIIPLPPLAEQERIVAKIEELFSNLDNAVETLKATKVQLEVYKQTVLYEAFSNLSDTVDMQEIATMIDPQPSHRTPPEVVGGIPYIGIGDIDYDNNIIKFDSARKVSASVLAEHLSRYTISKGDFVMGKIGTIGKPYRIPIPQEYALSANVILIQPNHELILPDFLYWQFSSHHVTSQLLKGANATSQPAFGIKKSRLLKIKMCDFEQQRAINLDIESKISVYESIAHTVEKSLEEASAMRQSILKQAFEGRLL